MIKMFQFNLQLFAHTTCEVCNQGIDIDDKDTYLCNGYFRNRHYVHRECFDIEGGFCDDCSEKADEE